MPIHHNLMALKGQKIKDIKEVYLSNGIITTDMIFQALSTHKIN